MIMENYKKGDKIELDDPYPFEVHDLLQMKICPNSKVRNLVAFATKHMDKDDVRQIAWNGEGNCITKTIACAEIMKRKIKVREIPCNLLLRLV